MSFDYDMAFSRNLGWITKQEQELIKKKRIAIAGLGGVGGVYLITLVRMGFVKFNLADFDVFEIQNFNRQAGASLSSIGKKKLDVMIQMAKDINPEIEINPFPEGVKIENMNDFLKDVDIYLDGLDFFCLEIREAVFAKTHSMGIPAITVGPIGMGATLVNFLPGGMSFDEYFGLSKTNDKNIKALLFAIGLSPKRIHASYLVDPSKMDFANQKAPSTPMGCQMCSAVAASEILKIILKRGPVSQAPNSIQYDAYLNKTSYSWVPFGYKNPIQRLRIFLGKKMYSKMLLKD
jgi:molybdopterin/thiamine biosynthesis adenylyltransferase